jgi:hypothetical protein
MNENRFRIEGPYSQALLYVPLALWGPSCRALPFLLGLPCVLVFPYLPGDP